MSVIKCHQQFRAAAKCSGSPMQACLQESWKCILGWTGRPSVADSSNKVAESRRSRRVCGLSPERREKQQQNAESIGCRLACERAGSAFLSPERRAKCREHIRETRIHMPLDMKDNIAEAARRLLMENNVKKLTVKDIVEECQITRQTFYYHFQDIPELISWVIERETERLRSKAEAQEDPEKRLKFFFAVSLNAMPYIRQSMLTNYRDEIGRILLAHFRRMIEESAEGKELAHRCSQAEFDLIIRYHSMAILGILASWSEEDTKHQDEVVHQIYKMIAEGIKIKQ